MTINQSSRENIKGVTLKLLEYCQSNDWAGYDPYDALNSQVFKALPFLNFRLFRLALTQGFKRSPINLRRLFLVPKTQNAKALALFLSALVKLSRIHLLEDAAFILELVEHLITLRSPDSEYWCWGYSFPWQTRTILVPRGQANIVCTTFVANALLDIYERNNNQEYLYMAVDSAKYILNELYWERGPSEAGFSYPLSKLENTVHNANFLGAALLCRVYNLTKDKKFLPPALKIARYSASQQQVDGSWDYGESGTQNWIDNFHTGYNLCALQSIGRHADTDEFEPAIRSGFAFYREHFFQEDGAPKYFHNRTYPIDIHSAAQSIITLITLKDLHKDNLALARSVLEWSLRYMWDDKGYFYYQINPFYKNRIPHMRWSQAWMLLALSMFLDKA